MADLLVGSIVRMSGLVFSCFRIRTAKTSGDKSGLRGQTLAGESIWLGVDSLPTFASSPPLFNDDLP